MQRTILKKKPLLMLPLVMIILILFGVTYNSTRVITEKTIEDHQLKIAAELANTIELWLKQHMTIIDATAAAVKEIRIGHNEDTMRILQMATRSGDFADVYIGLTNGVIIVGTGWVPPKGYDPRIRPWYRRAVEVNNTAFTSPYIDLTTMKMVIAIAKPLWIRDQFVGVLSSDIILDTLKKNVLNKKIGNSGYSFLIDRQGTILVHPDQTLEMKAQYQDLNPSLHDALDHFKQSTMGSYRYVSKTDEMILSYRRLSGSEWYLCTTIPKEEAYTLAKNTAMLLAMGVVFKILGVLALLTLLITVGSAAAFWISKRQFNIIVQQQKELLSNKEKILKGEISRRKDMETQYHTIFNMATNGILLSKKDTIVECNRKMEELFERPREQIIGKQMLAFSPKLQHDGWESRSRFREIGLALEADNQQTFKWTFLRTGGKQFPAEVSIKRFVLDRNVVTLTSIWDISKRENAEHKLRQAQKLAAMGEMISSIAHQWRQPLNALSTYVASLLPAHYNDMLSRSFLEKVVHESDSQIQFMSSTINDFREYFKPSKNKVAFDIHEAVGSAVKLMKPQLDHNWITLEVSEEDRTAKLPVLGYKNEFIHVLMNIISNAKDAINEHSKPVDRNPAGRIDIVIRKQARQVSIAIADTGTGVPEHLLEKVFTPYFTTKGTATGTGIGLYMSKMIVEKEMHGIICAENHGNGARIHIQLPLSST